MNNKFFEDLNKLNSPIIDALQKSEFIADYLKPFANSVKIDKYGNITASRSEGNNDIVIECPIDCSGIAVKNVEDKIKIEAIGSAKLLQKLNQEIIFQGGAVGILRSDKENPEKSDDFYVELVLGEVSIGDSGFFKTVFEYKDNTIIGNNISKNIAIAVVAEAFAASSKPVTVRFTTFNAFASDTLQNSDKLIFVGCCPISDNISPKKGGIVFIKGKNMLVNPVLHKKITEIAEKNNIKTQKYIGDDDFGLEKISISYTKSEIGGLFIPVSHPGCANEIIFTENINGVSTLLEKIIDGGF